jgi:membrane carboxypeptidase/penicillin-binding protein PbpC
MDGRPMQETLAVKSAAPLWAALMRQLLQTDRPLDPVHEGGNLTRVVVSKLTGLLPSGADEPTVNELFLKGTGPTTSDADWFTPVDGKKLLVLPGEFAGWCRSSQNYLDAITAPDGSLAITNPKADTKFEISDALPPAQQMIELSASLERGVEWFVNGTKIPPQADGRVMWQLQPGEWKVTAIVAGQTASASFIVERD